VKDPHIHVERTPLIGFGHAEMRDMITSVTGIAGDLPKTVRCGCGKRRPFAMISKVPAKVTCLACREWARSQHANEAASARSLAEWMVKDPGSFRDAKITVDELAELATEHEQAAAQYA
jgi:hypothetical protein